jgi:protein-tyrosine phosphatase/nicotinamidase-related amidase
MSKALLITQCLSRDFVNPIRKTDPLPNRLHIGYHEAQRLVGEDRRASPLNRVLNWAYAQRPDDLGIIHIRDWHSKDDPQQAAHLAQFGDHCLAGTPGASFIFDIPEAYKDRPTHIVNSLTLNDFIGTDLDALLAPSAREKTRVGIIGVWTEAKVTQLCYELGSRYPNFELAVCSALTAGSSRAQHFRALENLQRLFGVNVIDSVTDFVHYLGDESFSFTPATPRGGPRLEGMNPPAPDDVDGLVRYLFRDCARVLLKPLDGGFSGNYVLATKSYDADGREQAPHVLKVGPRALMAKERTSFEKVELVLGNNAPRIVDFADNGAYGAIKYRYASMGGGATRSFQKLFTSGAKGAEISAVLDHVFNNQLGRLYAASHVETCNLLDHYGFDSTLRASVERSIAAVLGEPPQGETLTLAGRSFYNPACFYDEHLDALRAQQQESRVFADVHGDLNGANILVDANRNVWIIDFFHTHYGHVLKDLIKLENDLLYIMTPIQSEADLKLAMKVTDALLSVKDLATPPQFPTEVMQDPVFRRTAKTILRLRRHYPRLLSGDIDPVQAMIGQLRYAVHTLSFDECTLYQKKWALYASGRLAKAVKESLTQNRDLRVSWVPLPQPVPGEGRLGLTILPGRRDRNRDLAVDIAALKEQGVTDVVTLVTEDELQQLGVPDLMQAYADAGLKAEQIQVADGFPATQRTTKRLVSEIRRKIKAGHNVLVHCVGGLGRSGTLVASVLIDAGLSAEAAIEQVRTYRSPRAIETALQSKFLTDYAARQAAPSLPQAYTPA